MIKYSVQQLAKEERPRERFLSNGPEALTAAELVALILGSGHKSKSVLELANEILAQFGCLKGLADATIAELMAIQGLGSAKSIQLKAAFHLGIRASRQILSPKYRIEHPIHAYHLLKEILENEKREIFIVILQDVKGYVICHEVVSIGSLTQTLVHPREVFYPAIRHKAASMLIAHNHPSGDLNPSSEDIHLTEVLIKASVLMGIAIHDHLIVARDGYFSFREKGIVFKKSIK